MVSAATSGENMPLSWVVLRIATPVVLSAGIWVVRRPETWVVFRAPITVVVNAATSVVDMA